MTDYNIEVSADVFDDGIDLADVENPTPAQAARAGWNEITRWVEDGYQPVLTVTMPDGTKHTIDLED